MKPLKAGFQLGPQISRKPCGIANLYPREQNQIFKKVYGISQLTHASDVRQEMKTCLCCECHQTIKVHILGSC